MSFEARTSSGVFMQDFGWEPPNLLIEFVMGIKKTNMVSCVSIRSMQPSCRRYFVSIWTATAYLEYPKNCLRAAFLHPREKNTGRPNRLTSYCPTRNTLEMFCCKRLVSRITGITGRIKTRVSSHSFSMRIIIRESLICLLLRPSNRKRNAAAI